MCYIIGEIYTHPCVPKIKYKDTLFICRIHRNILYPFLYFFTYATLH